MAVKEDNDICLNITGGNYGDIKKQSSKIAKGARLKRLAQNQSDKTKKPFQKFQSTESSKSLLVGAKKRIKQKSLANIVANNLKRASQPVESPKAPILKKSTPVQSAKKAPSGTESQDKPAVDKKRVSFGSKNAKDSNETLVSFTKPTKETAITTILAKKRKSDSGETKKSLSNIFNLSDSTETKMLKPDTQINAMQNKKQKFEFKTKPDESVHKNEFTLNTTKTLANRNHGNDASQRKMPHRDKESSDTVSFMNESNHRKFKQSRDKTDKSKNFKREAKEGNQRPHPSGKISSLFGHNPIVPNIGQRLVKPINEKVFSVEKFGELGIHAYAVSNLEQNMKITTMTTVQKKAIPVILSGKDVLVRSQTGSGKTLTYALPIIESLQSITPKLTRNSGIKALVIVPTRELALQTYECFLKLIKPFTWIVPGYLVGGEKRKAEKARLRKGCTVLVATPGRLLDHVKHTKALRLDSIKCFVLDEADRMLDMGYEKDISEIVAVLKNAQSEPDDSGYNAMEMLRQGIAPKALNKSKSDDESEEIVNEEENDSNEEGNKSDSNDETELVKSKSAELNIEKVSSNPDESHKRQTILLSATLTQAVEKLAGLTMNNPIFVDAARENIEAVGGNISEMNEDLVVPESVIQSYVVTPPKLRMVTLSAFIAGKCQSHGNHKILIFMATQDMVDYHTAILSTVLSKPIDEEDEDSDPLVDVEFFKLHGNMSQKERTEVFKTFRLAKSGVLLCTDVAARGLDLPKVDSVVQYTGPTTTRDYVHRIGRTARAGSAGQAMIFLTPPEVEFARTLEGRRIRIRQDDMDELLAKLLVPLSRHNSVQAAATALQNEFENLVIEDRKFHAMACKAYTSWIRFYSSYPREMRAVFNRKDLHLGHYAKSFALRDPPQKIGGAGKTIREKEESQQPRHQNRLHDRRLEQGPPAKGRPGDGTSQRQQDRRSGMLKKVRMLNVSEYDSGLEPIRKPRKP